MVFATPALGSSRRRFARMVRVGLPWSSWPVLRWHRAVHVVMGFPSPAWCYLCHRGFPYASVVLLDVRVGGGPAGVRVDRYVGGGPAPCSCGSIRQGWAPFAYVWVDRLAVGPHRVRMARHVSGGPAPHSCGSTRWRCARIAFVCLDASAVGSIPIGVARHAGGGLDSRWCGSTERGVFPLIHCAHTAPRVMAPPSSFPFAFAGVTGDAGLAFTLGAHPGVQLGGQHCEMGVAGRGTHLPSFSFPCRVVAVAFRFRCVAGLPSCLLPVPNPYTAARPSEICRHRRRVPTSL